MEQNYQFRARMDQVHKPDIRDFQAAAATDETVIDSSWVISYNSDAPQSVIDTAKDLLDYFSVSMFQYPVLFFSILRQRSSPSRRL